MNVLQMLPNLNLGGVERGTVDLAKALVEDNHHAVIISNGGVLLKELEGTKVKHYALPVHQKSLFSIISLIRPVRQIIKEEKIDIVHARSRVPAWIGYYAARAENVPFITTAHGFYKNHWGSRVMGFGKRVIVVSSPLKDYMKLSFNVPEQKLRLIHRGIDFNKELLSRQETDNLLELRKDLAGNAKNLVGMISRLTPRKGHLFFIEALAQLKKNNFPFRALIVGEAEKEKFLRQLKEKVKKENLENEIIFTGRRNDVPQILSILDLLVFPSVEPESFGRVVVEALALEKPVVATDLGGVKDIIEDGVNGRLVTPDDVLGLARAISWMLEHKEETKVLSQRGKDKVLKEFSLGKMYQETLKVYQECLKEQ